MRLALPLAFLALLIALPGELAADTVTLKNGQKLEGRIVKETPTHVFLKVPGLGEQPIPKADIKEVKKGESVFDQYDAKKKEVKADDAEARYQFGLWCEESKLKTEAKAEYEAAVKIDPEHAGARTKLGFIKYKGEWLTKKKYAEAMKALEAKEAGILAALALGDPHEDKEALFSIGSPKEWTKDATSGTVTFAGPELGGAKTTIEFVLTQLEDSLDSFVTETTDALKKIYPDLRPLADPADTKLLDGGAKFLSFGYSENGVPMERREILMVAPQGGHRLTISCAEGYYDKLKPFFDTVLSSLKRMEKPSDLENKEAGFSCAYPDENWGKLPNFPLGINNQQVNMPPGSVVIGHKTAVMACIVVCPGKNGDGRGDMTSLQTLRDSIPKVFPFPLQNAGNEKSIKVGGADALFGDLTIAGGQMGSGHWCVLVNGDRYFLLMMVNIFNRMGPQYAQEDFDKFLSGFKLL